MDELIKLLDTSLEYINHEVIKDTIYINIKSSKQETCCPDCNTFSKRYILVTKEAFKTFLYQGKNQL